MKTSERRSVRLPGFDYSAPGAYFVTIVTQDRACIFGRIEDGEMYLSGRGRIADECWRAIPEHFVHVELGAYVVMPNHMHGIIMLHDREAATAQVGAQHAAPLRGEDHPMPGPHVEPGSLGAIVRSYKSAVARRINQQFGNTPRLWQRNYYEHVIRDDTDWRRIHAYIESNVANWAQDDENR